jgi:hypothetical protein
MFSDQGSPTLFAERVAGLVQFSYTLADDIHSLVDDPKPGSGRLSARTRKLLIAGLVISGTTISTLAKIGQFLFVARVLALPDLLILPESLCSFRS